MRMLLLGGTAFLGRHIAGAALKAGIDVTCAARGSGPVADGCPLVLLDRDREDGLAPVAERTWDVVVDVARQPGHVRRAVRDLRADHWVYLSSASVYARFDQPEQHEDAGLLEPLEGEVLEDMGDYGRAKVACEDAIREGAASSTIVRAGLIGGTGDATGRSGYYPWRFAHPTGADVLVPPDLAFPTAMIDAADLAAWIVTGARNRVSGTFNATGPTTTLREVLEVARAVAGSTVSYRPVPAETLARAGVGAWMGTPSLPLWVDDPDWRWFATLDTTRARRAGLVTRPLSLTLSDASAYENRRTTPRACGLTDEEERGLRALLGS